MKVKELIERLQEEDPDRKVVIQVRDIQLTAEVEEVKRTAANFYGGSAPVVALLP